MRVVHMLYHKLLKYWNERNSTSFAGLFTEDGNLIGFDGSQTDGQSEIYSHISQIFSNHITSKYVGKVRSIRFLNSEVGVHIAVASMVRPDDSDIDPELNTIQTLVATKNKEEWKITVYQNTPAEFHGRPELREQLTIELRQVLQQHGLAS